MLQPQLDVYNYYIVLGWPKLNMAIARMTKLGRGNPK
jgi:hypothetical protein